MNDRGVLLLAHGTVDDLSRMREYLQDIAGGRVPSPQLVEEMTRRYAEVGGSPLTRITLEQAVALEQELARRGRPRRVYVGMRHWQPRIREAVARMASDGVRRAVGIVMSPHGARVSVERYRQLLNEALAATPDAPEVRLVERWWRQRGLDEAFAERMLEALRRRGASAADVHVLFTAHSLPVRAGGSADAYEADLREHAAALAARMQLRSWSFAFQSAGATPEPWLSPSLHDELARLAAAGVRRVLVVPIGFVCDHMEVLYDLDVEARRRADELGMELWRIESLNTAARFIGVLADVVEAAEQKGAPPE
ncbi:MAG: ferrochelatase [Kiritimatiellae bacterium]|nr:ferrochelatase [Kiritimatiellia bacterium]